MIINHDCLYTTDTMASDSKLRNLVERLLRDEFHPQLLTDIVLVLRSRSHGIASIAELGHFVAHSDFRTFGLITDEAKDVFRYLKYSMPYWWDKTLDWSDLPSDFSRFLGCNFRRLSSAQIKTATGISRKRAFTLMTSALGKFRVKSDGRQSVGIPFTEEESKLILYSYQTVVLRPFFTADSLHRDFLNVLEKNRLIATKERAQLSWLRPRLALYAIDRMNQTRLVLEDGWNAILHCSLINDGSSDRLLGISASVGFSPQLKGVAGWSYPVFSTDLIADDWCSEALVSQLLIDQSAPTPSTEVELTPEVKLIRL